MSDIQSFRQAVETFISARGWTPTRFGRTVAGDPLFVFDLREGREPRSDTRTRILKAMQEFGDGTALPPLRVGVAGLGNVGATLSPPWPPGRARAIAASTSRNWTGLTIRWLWPSPMVLISSSS